MFTLPLQPLAEILLLTVGTLLILLELHRPGWIFPGCVGLLAILITFASIARSPFFLIPIAAYLLYVLFATISTRTANSFILIGFVVAIFVAFSSVDFMASWPLITLALFCAAGIALLTEFFTRNARIARTNKFPPQTSNPTVRPKTL